MNKKIIIFSGPSGSGKTTIVHSLFQRFDNLMFSTSATTRAVRGSEVDGKDYYFLTKEDFLQKIEEKKFIEYEEVYPGTYYGTLHTEIERIWAKNNIPILDIDVQGALRIKSKFPDNTLIVFIHPISMDILENRLRSRNTEKEESILMRLSHAKEEITHADKFDFIIYNDDSEMSITKAESIVKSYLIN